VREVFPKENYGYPGWNRRWALILQDILAWGALYLHQLRVQERKLSNGQGLD